MELILSSGHNFSEYQCYATKINKGRWVGKDAIFSKILFNFVGITTNFDKTMSVCIGAIIPYDFKKLSDVDASLKEIAIIRDKLMAYFHMEKEFESQNEIHDDNDGNIYQFEIPFCGFCIQLKNGFIYIRTAYNYSQYFYKLSGFDWLRNLFYDIVSALGASEAWIADDYHLDFCGPYDWFDVNFTLNDWLACRQPISLFDEKLLFEYNSDQYIEHQDYYLDRFESCKKYRQELQQQFPEYNILMNYNIGDCFALATKDDRLVLLNRKTKKELRTGNIDAVTDNLNRAGFVIYKGNTSALFCNDGKKLTPYRVREFDLDYNKKSQNRIVIDTKTKNIVWEENILK
jgi:hypothetical protein